MASILALCSCVNCLNKSAACAQNRTGNALFGYCPMSRGLLPARGTAAMAAASAAMEKADAASLAAISLEAAARFKAMAPAVSAGDVVEYEGADGALLQGRVFRAMDDFVLEIRPVEGGNTRAFALYCSVKRNITAESAKANAPKGAAAIDDLDGLAEISR